MSSEPTNRSGLLSLAMRLALAAAALLLALGALELALRVVGPSYHRFGEHSQIYYSNPRGYHDPMGRDGEHELYGLRYWTAPHGSRLPDERSPTARKEWERPGNVLVLGDSFTYGRGVRYEDTWARQLERSALAAGRALIIENHAVSGYDLEQISVEHDRATAERRYPLVIYGFVLNDFDLPDAYEIVGLDLIDLNNEVSHDPWRQRSALVNTVAHSVDLQRLHNTTMRAYREAFEDPWAAPRFEELAELHERVRDREGELVIVLFPLLHELDDYAFRAAHDRLAGFCSDRGIPFLDLLPAYQQHSAEELWANPTDHHPNETGHALAAEALLAFLAQEGLLEGLEPPPDDAPPRQGWDEPRELMKRRDDRRRTKVKGTEGSTPGRR